MNLVSKDISDDFPKSDKIYLNNASVSLMPSQSIEDMKEFLISYSCLRAISLDLTKSLYLRAKWFSEVFIFNISSLQKATNEQKI